MKLPKNDSSLAPINSNAILGDAYNRCRHGSCIKLGFYKVPERDVRLSFHWSNVSHLLATGMGIAIIDTDATRPVTPQSPDCLRPYTIHGLAFVFGYGTSAVTGSS